MDCGAEVLAVWGWSREVAIWLLYNIELAG